MEPGTTGLAAAGCTDTTCVPLKRPRAAHQGVEMPHDALLLNPGHPLHDLQVAPFSFRPFLGTQTAKYWSQQMPNPVSAVSSDWFAGQTDSECGKDHEKASLCPCGPLWPFLPTKALQRGLDTHRFGFFYLILIPH